jgi:hypothetical protein
VGHESDRQVECPDTFSTVEASIKAIACIRESIDISFLNVICPIIIVEYVERWGPVTLKSCCAFPDMLCSQFGYKCVRRILHCDMDFGSDSRSSGADRFLNSQKSHSADREDL